MPKSWKTSKKCEYFWNKAHCSVSLIFHEDCAKTIRRKVTFFTHETKECALRKLAILQPNDEAEYASSTLQLFCSGSLFIFARHCLLANSEILQIDFIEIQVAHVNEEVPESHPSQSLKQNWILPFLQVCVDRKLNFSAFQEWINWYSYACSSYCSVLRVIYLTWHDPVDGKKAWVSQPLSQWCHKAGLSQQIRPQED